MMLSFIHPQVVLHLLFEHVVSSLSEQTYSFKGIVHFEINF